MLAFLRIALILMSSVLLTSTFAQQATTNFVVSDAWIREAPPNSMVLGGYMMIDNSDDHRHRLLGAYSSACEASFTSFMKERQAKGRGGGEILKNCQSK